MIYNQDRFENGSTVSSQSGQKNARKISKVKFFLLIFAAFCYVSVLLSADIRLIITDTLAGLIFGYSINQLLD